METGGAKSPKLLVYSRRKLNQKSSDPETLHGQESDLNINPENKSGAEFEAENQQAKSRAECEPLNDSVYQRDIGLQSHDVSLYLPIALRKGTRSCTQHPISQFVSYEKTIT